MCIKNERGVGIAEAIIVISIISVSFTSLLGAAVFFFRNGLEAANQVEAIFLLDESVEAVRFMRDESFLLNIKPLVGTGPRYIDIDTSGWSATSTNVLIDDTYTRTIELTEVYRRNSDDVIVPSTSADLKTLDPGTVELTVTVSWDSNTLTASTYLADLYEN